MEKLKEEEAVACPCPPLRFTNAIILSSLFQKSTNMIRKSPVMDPEFSKEGGSHPDGSPEFFSTTTWKWNRFGPGGVPGTLPWIHEWTVYNIMISVVSAWLTGVAANARLHECNGLKDDTIFFQKIVSDKWWTIGRWKRSNSRCAITLFALLSLVHSWCENRRFYHWRL